MTITEYVEQLKDKVFNFGQEIGNLYNKLPEIYNKGKADERNTFWGDLQKNGSTEGVNYYYAFAYNRFKDNNFNPQFPIICSSGTTPSQYMFYSAINITDTKVPIVLGSNAQGAFGKMEKLTTIRSLKTTASTTYNSAFTDDTKLKNIYEWLGEIGQNISFADCPLSKASIEVVFGALSNSAASKKVTFKESAVISAFGSTESQEWLDLVATKLNWAIAVA